MSRNPRKNKRSRSTKTKASSQGKKRSRSVPAKKGANGSKVNGVPDTPKADIRFDLVPVTPKANGRLDLVPVTPKADIPLDLLPQHLADLRRSGLSDQQIAACGFYSISDPREIAEHLGWDGKMYTTAVVGARALGPCLAIPFFGADGNYTGYTRLKPDKPRTDKNGKPIRYESPRGKPNRAFFPPQTRAILADPSKPLLVCEGEKKAARADQSCLWCVGLVGVWGWMKRREDKSTPRKLIEDLANIPWQGRLVFLVFDSDLASNEDVRWAEYHLARVLAKKGATVKVVRLPPGPPDENGRATKCGLDDFLLEHTVEEFFQLLRKAGDPADGRTEVVLSAREDLSVRQAVEALAARDRNLYQRGGQLVRVRRTRRPPAVKRVHPSNGLKIQVVPDADLRTRLTRFARLVQVRKLNPQQVLLAALLGQAKPDTKVDVHPTGWLVKGVLACGDWPGIRPLEGVIEAPVLLPDGSVLQKPGYDPRTGLLYKPCLAYPPVPHAPTKDDAARACAALREVVCDFPFASAAHAAAWLASVLTLVGRFAINGPAPLFLIDSNTRGSGKGKLASATSLIGTGRDLAVTNFCPDCDETRKMITGFAMQGERAVLFDNVTYLGNAALDAALTATEWQNRILGKNESPRLPLQVCWFATANNAVVVGDTNRRVLPIRLDSPEEKPETRTGFRHPDLLAWAHAERGRLLVAALTILSAYFRAGRPDQKLAAWGSYEAWTALIRNAVVWVGLEDPSRTREVFTEQSDQDTLQLKGLVEGWEKLQAGSEGLTASQAIDKLKEPDPLNKYAALRGVVEEAFNLPSGKLPTPNKLGSRLRRFKGRNVGGKCFGCRMGHGSTQVWFVRDVRRGGGGGSGGSGNPPSQNRPGEQESTESRRGDLETGVNTPSTPSTPSREPGEDDDPCLDDPY
jgi:hypothetical protein